MNNVYADYKIPTQGGSLLKIADGQTVRLRIMSEPAVYQSEYKGNLATRYAWTVWNTDEQAAQILQQSATFYRKIANLAQDEDWGDPTTYGIKVTREGSDTDTVYHVTPATAKNSLTEEQQAEIGSIDLLAVLERLPSTSHIAWLADVIEQSANMKNNSISGTEDVKGKEIPFSGIPFQIT